MTRTPQKKPASKKSGGGTLIGIFVGLVLGVLLSAGVMWYIKGSSLPLQMRSNTPAPAELPAEPAALPGKPGDKAPARPRPDFYDMLPGEARTPGPDAETVPAQASVPATEQGPAAAPETPAVRLILQAGAFSSEDEADNLRARLALIGLESSVQKGEVAGKGTLYRVRLGPFASTDDMQRVRAELAQNGIDASLVR